MCAVRGSRIRDCQFFKRLCHPLPVGLFKVKVIECMGRNCILLPKTVLQIFILFRYEDPSESGNRIVDIGALEKAVHDVACCKKCAEKWHREQLMKFFNYCDENKRRNPVSEQYQTWLSLQDKGDEIGCSCQLSVSSESHGFASDIIFRCDRKIDGAAEPHEAKAEASLVREGSLSNSRLVHAKYQLNHRVVAFLQICGWP